MYTQQSLPMYGNPQFYTPQGYPILQQPYAPVMYSNRKLEHINCVLAENQEEGGLFIGDTISTLKQQLLNDNKIQAILCCNAEAANNIHNLNMPMSFKYLEMQDHIQYPIKLHFQSAINFIQSNIKNKKNVLVQCHAGVSRSGTIICAYLINKKQWTHQQAYRYLKEKRHRAKPNAGFWNQLYEYSQKMKQRRNKNNETQKNQKIAQKEKILKIRDSSKMSQINQLLFTTPTKNKNGLRQTVSPISSIKTKTQQGNGDIFSEKKQRVASQVKNVSYSAMRGDRTPPKMQVQTEKKMPQKANSLMFDDIKKKKARQSVQNGQQPQLPFEYYKKQNQGKKKQIQTPQRTPQFFNGYEQKSNLGNGSLNNIYYSPQSHQLQGMYQQHPNRYSHDFDYNNNYLSTGNYIPQPPQSVPMPMVHQAYIYQGSGLNLSTVSGPGVTNAVYSSYPYVSSVQQSPPLLRHSYVGHFRPSNPF